MISSWTGYGWQDGDIYFAASSFFFSVGREYPLFHLMKGNSVVLHPSLFTPMEYVDALNASGATAAFVVPTLLKKLVAICDGDGPLLPGLRILSIGGEPSDPATRQRALQVVSPNIYQVYGAAGIGMIAVADPRYTVAHPDSVGRISPMVEAKTVDDEGRDLPEGESGWLLCRGSGMSPMHGDGNSETVVDGWYRPGDIGRIGKDRRLVLEGRHADRIIRGGVNLSCAEIESVIGAFIGTGNVAVVAAVDAEQGEVPVAFVESSEGERISQLIAHCRRRLGPFKTPAKILQVEAMPVTASGKIDRKALRKLAKES